MTESPNPDNGPVISGLTGEFDLKHVLRLLWTGKPWIIVVALLGLGLGFLVTYLETPIYRAQSLVQIDPPGQNLSALSNPYPATAFNYFDHRNYYNTQYRVGASPCPACPRNIRNPRRQLEKT